MPATSGPTRVGGIHVLRSSNAGSIRRDGREQPWGACLLKEIAIVDTHRDLGEIASSGWTSLGPSSVTSSEDGAAAVESLLQLYQSNWV